VLWEKEGFSWNGQWRVPNAPIEQLKQQAGVLAHEFYGRPSEALWVCGVTGTLGSGFPGALTPLPNTTPDALELHFTLKQMLSGGAKAAAMEVSSHGL